MDVDILNAEDRIQAMPKKRAKEDRTERFSASKYFAEDYEGYRPFADVKLITRKEAPVKADSGKDVKASIKPISRKVYDMYTPGATNVIQKNEELPLSLLKECEPQDSLDLHGKRPERDDIPSIVDEFLSEAVSRGRRKVEIVAGRGRHSDGEPVLPGIVESVLKNSPVVRDFETAPANRGGKGCYWIILGKRGARPLNVYSTEEQGGNRIKGLDRLHALKAKKPKPIDYDSYMPGAEDIRDKR